MKVINLPPIPTIIGFRRWQQELYVALRTASKRSQRRTMKWIKEVDNTEDVTTLDTPLRRWDDLDSALASAICHVAWGPIQRDLMTHQEKLAKHGRSLTGRAALLFVRFSMDRG